MGTSESLESFFDMYQRLAVCADGEGIKLPETVDLKKLEQILGARGCSRKATLEHISEIMGINKKNKPVYGKFELQTRFFPFSMPSSGIVSYSSMILRTLPFLSYSV